MSSYSFFTSFNHKNNENASKAAKFLPLFANFKKIKIWFIYINKRKGTLTTTTNFSLSFIMIHIIKKVSTMKYCNLFIEVASFLGSLCKNYKH